MAKQGYWKFERTIQGLVFYRLYGKWYIRRVSSLSGRRVKTSKKFIKSMICANRLGLASAMASAVYDPLPDGWKMFELYQQLVSIGIRMLKENNADTPLEEILKAMEQQLFDWGYRRDIKYERVKPSTETVRISQYRIRNRRRRKNIGTEEEFQNDTVPTVTIRLTKEKARRQRSKMRNIRVPHYAWCPKKKKLVYVRKELVTKIKVPPCSIGVESHIIQEIPIYDNFKSQMLNLSPPQSPMFHNPNPQTPNPRPLHVKPAPQKQSLASHAP